MYRFAFLRITLANLITSAAMVAAQSPAAPPNVPAAVSQGLKEFSADAIKGHIKFLSDDLLEGRGPGTRGDELAQLYLATQFESYGLQPAGDNGTYFQAVPLIGISTQPHTKLTFQRDAQTLEPKLLDDYVATDQTQSGSAMLDSDVVFVGHGVVAPEYKWDDYKGVDVRGKLLVMLVDDPPATQKEPDLFKGKARTYYGRWTYKYEIGLDKGAAGVLLIHTDDTAGYPWDVVRNSWGRERAYVRVAPGASALKLAGWMTEGTAGRLMQISGQDLQRLTAAAHSRNFRPVPLKARVQGSIVSSVREFNTANVVAKLEGSDPALRDEYVVYTAHHDHLGIGKPENGDAIYNGALDNASGSAILLEMARVWSLNEPPKRSILFAAVAAEEQGLLGSEYLAFHPLVPPGKTAVGLNFDGIEMFGPVRNITMLGVERTSFHPIAQRVARALDVRIDPDEHPEQGSYYRSDHFSLAKVGIPSFSISPGSDYVGKPKEFGQQMFEDYNKNRYHQPDDEYESTWDFSEGVQMGQLGFWLGWEGAMMPSLVTWNRGDEFFNIREASFRGTQ
jgi:Zn-dependent M28 family amino/carboxypeptidase